MSGYNGNLLLSKINKVNKLLKCSTFRSIREMYMEFAQFTDRANVTKFFFPFHELDNYTKKHNFIVEHI